MLREHHEQENTRGWCVAVQGLCAEKSVWLVTACGFSDRESATAAAQQEDGARARAMREPKIVTVCEYVSTESGLSPTDNAERVSWADAVRRCRENEQLYISYPPTKRKAALIAAALAVLLVAVAVGIGVAALTKPGGIPVGSGSSVSSAVSAASGKADTVESSVLLTLDAEGADSTATKAAVVVSDADGKTAVLGAEVEANKSVSVGELPEGEYALYVTVAPVCENGTSYKLPAEAERFKVDGKGGDVRLSISLERIEPEEMSKEQLEAAASVLESAGKSEASQSVSSRAQSAVSQPGSASTIKNESSAPTAPPVSSSGSSSTGSVTTPSTTPTPSPSPSPSPTPSPAPHEHSWVHHDAVYNTVHHDAVYDYVYHDAVRQGVYVCNDCGSQFYSAADEANHEMNGLANGTGCGIHGYYVTSIVIQEAWNEPVLVSAAWDEQVLVSAAYDSCACGATQ